MASSWHQRYPTQPEQQTKTEVRNQAAKVLAPSEANLEITTPYHDTYTLIAIPKIRHLELWSKSQLDPTNIAYSDKSTEIIELLINVIQSKDTALEEQALGFYTRRKLKNLSIWSLCYQGETNQPVWRLTSVRQTSTHQQKTEPHHIMTSLTVQC